jgi:hypothetical protein
VARKTAAPKVKTAPAKAPAPSNGASAAAPLRSTPARALVSEQQIRVAAYMRWEAAGKPEGDGTHFWLEAERELQMK